MKPALSLLLALTCVLCLAAPAQAQSRHAANAGKPRLIVLEPTGERMAAAVLQLLDDVVLTEASRSPRYDVLGSSDIKRMLGQVNVREQMGCDDDKDQCLAEIGGALGAQFLLTSNLGRLGTKFVVNMKLLDVSHARVVARRSDSVDANEDALAASVRRMVAGLFPEERGVSAGTWIAVGTGVAGGLAYGALFSLAGSAGNAGDLTAQRERAVGADVAGGVAIAAGVAALVLFASHPADPGAAGF